MDTYEKEYKDALERAKKLQETCDSTAVVGWCEYIFPELKESEDEESKKWILEYLYDGMRMSDEQFKEQFKSAISWLEKQGKQILANSAKTCKNEQKPFDYENVNIQQKDFAPKVELKFKVGDWCIDNEDGTIFQIVKVLDNTYIYKTNEGKEYSCTHYSLENDAKLWTIQDARDGDVLYSLDSNRPFIFKERNRYAQATAYCGLNIYGRFFVWDTKDCVITLSNYVPATKEQYDLLFAKMKEAGYTWDAEKKELKKVEQKPTWSAEDEKCLENAIMYCEWARDKAPDLPCYETSENSIKWLKSLKNRVQPKQEWSEEDEERVKKHPFSS